MKKTVSILAVILLAFSIISCGNTVSEDRNYDTTESSSKLATDVKETEERDADEEDKDSAEQAGLEDSAEQAGLEDSAEQAELEDSVTQANEDEESDVISVSDDEESKVLLESSDILEKVPMLENWYLTSREERSVCAIGNVYNRVGFEDGTPVVTSTVRYVHTDFDKQVVLVQTRNTLYRCYFDKCDINNPDFVKEFLPEYDEIKSMIE